METSLIILVISAITFIFGYYFGTQARFEG